jgi:hypothetical protein
MKMSRDVWSFGIYSLLSLVIMTGTFRWLDEKNAITSDLALEKAEQKLYQFHLEGSRNAQGIRLKNATAPNDKQRNWQFQFQPPSGPPITVEVSNEGKASVVKQAGR